MELTLAGLGSRLISGMFDLTIQGVIYFAFAFAIHAATDGGSIGAAILAVAAFLIVFAYDVCFEVLAGGRTPGKRWTGLRVMRDGGRPITFVPSAIRNVLRFADFLPGMYAIGTLFVFLTPRNQRLGDIAAGTIVVRERRAADRLQDAAAEPGEVGPAPAWDVSGISAADVAVVRNFLARRRELEPAAADKLAHDLAARLRPRVAGAAGHMSNEEFLRRLAAAKAARE